MSDTSKEIYDKYLHGVTISQLAKEYGVVQERIRQLIKLENRKFPVEETEFTIVASYWQYNNFDMKITKKSERKQKIFKGMTIEEAFSNYGNAYDNHDVFRNSPLSICNITSEKVMTQKKVNSHGIRTYKEGAQDMKLKIYDVLSKEAAIDPQILIKIRNLDIN